MNLATFKNLTKVVKVSVKERVILLKYHRDVFGQISIIMQKRHIDMNEVLSFPLGPLPWSLAGVAGDLKKTNKASLLHKIEQNAPPLEEVPRNSVGIFDGMAEVQAYNATGLTFAEFGDGLFRSILNKACSFKRIL